MWKNEVIQYVKSFFVFCGSTQSGISWQNGVYQI